MNQIEIIKIFSAASLVLMFSFSAQAQEPAGLSSAIKQHLKIDNETPAPKFQYSITDLNGDGNGDAIVLITDNDYCGSGGCVLEIFRGVKNGFKFISASTISKPPIRVLNSTSNGWKSIVGYSGGTGNVVLNFNGKRYPNNPSLQPKASDIQINTAKIVINGYAQ